MRGMPEPSDSDRLLQIWSPITTRRDDSRSGLAEGLQQGRYHHEGGSVSHAVLDWRLLTLHVGDRVSSLSIFRFP